MPGIVPANMATKGQHMITNMKRIMRNGVPHYVAPWYSTLTTEGKAMIGQGGAMTATPRKYLTKMDYKPRMTNEEFMLANSTHYAHYAIAAE